MALIYLYPSAEENMETVLSAVLKDPLESSMEGIEDLATGILRTGKLSVQGEAGGVCMCTAQCVVTHTHTSVA